ncbi:hypothetical protein LTR50_006656 [Elasticomyces elasticus]|nr:hypothetical protein LTR50_006656 [Elasticomyces elasticus]
MKRRLFWLNHSHPEARTNKQQDITTSHHNDFEVRLTAALVSHLVRQGVYKSGEIAVLTPYLGQLRKITDCLSASYEILLNDRDVDFLQREGTGAETTAPASPFPSTKSTLLRAIRIATVDNFEGEEAKVVVISLVRSNANRNCGFLKTANRINVLLSRAQHGMYIIGNAETSRHVPMWADVLAILQRSGNFGNELELSCPRHADTSIRVRTPDDFLRLSPEGGCGLICGQRLGCGHRCIVKCHSQVLHAAVKCNKPCMRSKDGCNHVCPLLCGIPCHEKCQEIVSNMEVVLPCGHVANKLPCWQYQDPASVLCGVAVKNTLWSESVLWPYLQEDLQVLHETRRWSDYAEQPRKVLTDVRKILQHLQTRLQKILPRRRAVSSMLGTVRSRL